LPWTRAFSTLKGILSSNLENNRENDIEFEIETDVTKKLFGRYDYDLVLL
jgi:hypothetical protein